MRWTSHTEFFYIQSHLIIWCGLWSYHFMTGKISVLPPATKFQGVTVSQFYFFFKYWALSSSYCWQFVYHNFTVIKNIYWIWPLHFSQETFSKSTDETENKYLIKVAQKEAKRKNNIGWSYWHEMRQQNWSDQLPEESHEKKVHMNVDQNNLGQTVNSGEWQFFQHMLF